LQASPTLVGSDDDLVHVVDLGSVWTFKPITSV